LLGLIHKKYLYLELLISFIVIATVISWGFSRDSQTYNEFFNIYGASGWGALSSEVFQYELFFLVISKVVYGLGFSSVLLFLAYSAISIPIKLHLIYEHSKDKFLSLALFGSYFFILHDSTQIRFGIAIAFAYLGLHFLANNKKLLFVAIVIFSAAVFHNAILVFLVMLFLNRNKSYLLALCLVVLSLALYPANLSALLLEVIKNIVDYFNLEGTRLNTLYRILWWPTSDIFLGIFRPIPILVYSCALVIYRYRSKFSAFESLCYNALLLSIFFYIFLKDLVDLQVRFADMFGFSLVFLVPYVHRGISEYIGEKYAYIILYSFFIVHLVKFTLYDKMLIL